MAANGALMPSRALRRFFLLPLRPQLQEHASHATDFRAKPRSRTRRAPTGVRPCRIRWRGFEKSFSSAALT